MTCVLVQLKDRLKNTREIADGCHERDKVFYLYYASSIGLSMVQMLHLLNTYTDCRFAQLHAKRLFDIPEICVTALPKSVDCRAPSSCCLSFTGKVVHWVLFARSVRVSSFAGVVNRCVRRSLGSSLTQGPSFTAFVAWGGIAMSASGSPPPRVAVALGWPRCGSCCANAGLSCTRHVIVQFDL